MLAFPQGLAPEWMPTVNIRRQCGGAFPSLGPSRGSRVLLSHSGSAVMLGFPRQVLQLQVTPFSASWRVVGSEAEGLDQQHQPHLGPEHSSF